MNLRGSARAGFGPLLRQPGTQLRAGALLLQQSCQLRCSLGLRQLRALRGTHLQHSTCTQMCLA